MIEVHELTKVFPSPKGDEVRAVDGVSFRVGKGEVYGLLGPNGAGKTTTLRMILGLLAPTSGWAAIEGFRSEADAVEVKRRVGLLSASAGLYPWLSVREYLLYFADLYDVSPDVAERELARLARLLGFEEYLDRRCAVLSTGQKQRVQLARSLIHSPAVMLLDEPTLGLDILGSQVVAEFVDHLRQEGKAVILCTHHLDEAERWCDRFGLMHRGRIVIEGTLDELRRQTGRNSLVEMFHTLANLGRALAKSGP